MSKRCPTCGAPVEQLGDELYYIPVFPEVDIDDILDEPFAEYEYRELGISNRTDLDDLPNTYHAGGGGG